MKTIIAGGRDYKFCKEDLLFLRTIKDEVTEVVSGGAKGADSEGEKWAVYHDIPIELFEANWKEHGRSAGPIRNEQMAMYADAVVLFSGGKGTKNMYNNAIKYNLKIYDRRE